MHDHPAPDSTAERPGLIRGLREKLGLAAGRDDEFADLRSSKTQMALALGRVKHPSQVYAGTVPFAVVERRRTKNRAARRARRLNRGLR